MSTEEVETATLLHEFGHLFGLVNLSTQSVNEHEDTESDNHCNVDGCLMRSELEFGSSLLKQMEKMLPKAWLPFQIWVPNVFWTFRNMGAVNLLAQGIFKYLWVCKETFHFGCFIT